LTYILIQVKKHDPLVTFSHLKYMVLLFNICGLFFNIFSIVLLFSMLVVVSLNTNESLIAFLWMEFHNFLWTNMFSIIHICAFHCNLWMNINSLLLVSSTDFVIVFVLNWDLGIYILPEKCKLTSYERVKIHWLIHWEKKNLQKSVDEFKWRYEI